MDFQNQLVIASYETHLDKQKYLLFLQYNSVQDTGTYDVQVLQYLIAWGIYVCKNIVLPHRS